NSFPDGHSSPDKWDSLRSYLQDFPRSFCHIAARLDNGFCSSSKPASSFGCLRGLGHLRGLGRLPRRVSYKARTSSGSCRCHISSELFCVSRDVLRLSDGTGPGLCFSLKVRDFSFQLFQRTFAQFLLSEITSLPVVFVHKRERDTFPAGLVPKPPSLPCSLRPWAELELYADVVFGQVNINDMPRSLGKRNLYYSCTLAEHLCKVLL